MSLRHRLRFALLLVLFLASACAPIPFLSGEVRMSADELTQRMARRFPMEKSVAGLLDITLANPRVDLSEKDNRITTSFQLAAKMPLAGKSITGNLKISGRPEYVPESRALFLRDPQVEQLRLDNMTDALSAALAKTISSVAREALADRALHTFQPEDFTKYGIQYVPERILVRGDHLVLTLRK